MTTNISMYSMENAKNAFAGEPRNYYHRRWKVLMKEGRIDRKTRRITHGSKEKRIVKIGFIDGFREFKI